MRLSLVLAGLVLGLTQAGGAGGGVPCGKATLNLSPQFSPDGSRLVFVSGGGGGCSLSGRLMVSDGRGSTPSHLLPGVLAETPRISPDGRLLAATVWLRDQGIVELIDWSGNRRMLTQGRAPDWSPDGNQLAFSRDDELWVFDIRGENFRQLGRGSGPRWSPDGSWIAMRTGFGGDIALVRPDGSARRLVASRVFGGDLAWAPDGGRLAYTSVHGFRVFDLATGETTVARLPKNHGIVAWSSDGRRILLTEGLVFDLLTSRTSRPFGFRDVRAVASDWTRAAVSVKAGHYAYEGNDLYVADSWDGSVRLASPRRCDTPPPPPDLPSGPCLEGTDGDDVLRAEATRPTLRGLAGHDVLQGGAGLNRLEGALGNDVLRGGGGTDFLFGANGRDRLLGGPGDDLLDGGPDDDVLVSGSGRGQIFGGPGNDRIDARAGIGTRVYCQEGVDTVLANRTSRVNQQDCERVIRR